MSDLKQLNIRIPSSSHTRLKLMAVLSGKPMATIIAELIERYVDEQGEPCPELWSDPASPQSGQSKDSKGTRHGS